VRWLLKESDLHLVVHDTELNFGAVLCWLKWVFMLIIIGAVGAAL
jgi:hypothetical protein